MATKYILIPKDMYDSLINSKNENFNQVGVEFTKKELKKPLKNNINKSAKNILYNQELRRYLKINREEKDKPIKVNIANKDINNAISKYDSSTNTDKIVVSNEKDEPEIISSSPSFWSLNEIDETPIRPPGVYLPKKNPNKQNIKVEPISTPRQLRIQKPVSDTRAQRIMEIVQKTPNQFGVTENFEILNSRTQKPYINSSFSESVVRIVNPDPGENYSPPGTHALRSAILQNPATSKIMKERQQSGKGYRKNDIKTKRFIVKSFKPMLWN